MRFLLAVWLSLFGGLVQAAEQIYTCVYFGASYDMAQQPVPMRSQPIGYWLPITLAPAGIAVRNYSLPGSTTEQLWQQYAEYKSYADQAEPADCVIIGMTGYAIQDYGGVRQWAMTVATQERGRSIVVALSYPRRNIYDDETLARIQAPADWDEQADLYDHAVLQAEARLVVPFRESKTMTKRHQNDRDPDWVYDRFHLSNYAAMSAAYAIASKLLILFDEAEK